MGRDDWFRRTTWSAQDEEGFFTRLHRSRTDYDKAQYLRIQALHLEETGNRRLLRVAIRLLDELFTMCPDPREIPSAHLQRGRCLLGLGETDKGFEELRAAAVAQGEEGAVRCLAHLEFGWEVIRHGRRELIGTAIDLLEEFTEETDFLFPTNAYRYFATLAIASDWEGSRGDAAHLAKRALEAADRDENLARHLSGLRLGRNPDRRVHRRLVRLAKSAP